MTVLVASERETGFAGLFRAHVAAVRGFVRTLVRDGEVEDIVAATFKTAWARYDDVPPERARSWLFGVARNHVRNHVRAARRRAVLVDALTANVDPAHRIVHGDDPVDVSPLRDALARLSEGDREVLQLAAWHGMEPREIADVLAIDPNAARVRLHRARRRLADELGSSGEGGWA